MRLTEIARQAKLTSEVFCTHDEFDNPREFLRTLTEQLVDQAVACGMEPKDLPEAWCR